MQGGWDMFTELVQESGKITRATSSFGPAECFLILVLDSPVNILDIVPDGGRDVGYKVLG